MHEQTELEEELQEKAQEIQQECEGEPPVAIIVGGKRPGPNHTQTGSVGLHRLRDFNGLLETAIQIESAKHFQNFRN